MVDVVDFPDFVFDYQEALLTEDSGFFFIKFFVDAGFANNFFFGNILVLVLDISTDGIWCYIVLWVVPHSSSIIRWTNLKNRLMLECPSCSVSFYFNQLSTRPTCSPVYLLKLFCLDRKGLLHGNRNR